ncbi:hypothetical protein PC113_g14802 [Phytophthora cactorum]|uniref:Uncharacterized protein n=1 Tax=Phytophthora cactorum TaxID=29920 RepID=A0A8T0YRX6_9STRA|nr:hypothetical protein PC113_g14802 [Phytophthora cactorum]KAG3074245.1 hypothetical protein PC122_g14481 [Phytophthora cactorum]KAG3157884.1 hypothetical protein C6341_g14614 [Phytophthora cactorum]
MLKRALKTVNGGDAAEEERGAFLHTFNFNAWDEIFFFFNKMPEQFQRMRTEPEYLRYILASWYTGLQDMDQVVAFMTKTNLTLVGVCAIADVSAKAHKRHFQIRSLVDRSETRRLSIQLLPMDERKPWDYIVYARQTLDHCQPKLRYADATDRFLPHS